VDWRYHQALLARIPKMAANMIAAGFSTPTLDELAGLPNAADPQGLSTMLMRAGSELGYQPLEDGDNRLAVGRLYLELMVVGALDPYEGSRLIWKTIYWHLPNEAQWDFSAFAALGSEWEDNPGRRPELDAAILEAAREQLANLN
jgi:hypothetical protein